MATGILNCGVRTEADAAIALLGDHIENKSVPLRTSAIVGLGLAYVGSQREDVTALLLPILSEDSNSMEIVSLTALSLGLINVGSCGFDVTNEIMEVLMQRDESALDEKWARFLVLGLALLYTGMRVAAIALQFFDIFLQVARTGPRRLSKL